jgi:hypothetical protein
MTLPRPHPRSSRDRARCRRRDHRTGPRLSRAVGGFPNPANLGRQSRLGAVTLEFALVIPVLLLLLTGILEFGRVGLLGIPIAEAARTGAVYGAMNPPDELNPSDWARQCELRAREVLANQAGINPSLVEVQCTYSTGSPLNRSTVQVRYPFTLLIGWTPAPSNLVIQRTAVIPVIR